MANEEEEEKRKERDKCPNVWVDPHAETQKDAEDLLKRLSKTSGDIIYDANLFSAIESCWIQDSHPENGGPISEEIARKLIAQKSFYIQLQTYNLLKEILKEMRKRK